MDGRNYRFRRLAERIRGKQGEPSGSTPGGLPAAAVILIATAMFALVFAWRELSSSNDSGFALFYCIPIALIAVRFGVLGGLIAATVAELLFIVAALTVADYSGALPYLSRATAFYTLGLLVGYLSQRLASNERRISVALRNAPVLAFSLDCDLRYTWVHHSWSGRVDVDMIGRTDLELLHDGEGEVVYAMKKRVLESGEEETQEVALHDPKGRKRWFRTTVEPTFDARGRVSGLTGASFDVTEIKEALEEVAKSEERFRGAVESLLEPFAIYTAVRDEAGAIVDFRCEFINTAGAETVGMESDAMRGKLISTLFPGRLEYGLIDRYARVVESGEPHVRDEVDYVNVFGEDQLVRAFDMVVAKFGDGVQITWRDITDRVRAEVERDRLASIVDASIDAVMSADLDGTVRTWSAGAERLYGWTADEMIGRNFRPVLIPPELHSVRGETFARVAAGESVGPVVASELCKNGSKIRVAFTATPITGPSGEIVGVARIVRPVDDRPEYFTIDEDEAAAGGHAKN